MFLWQNKFSCNGSFQLVCQDNGNGSIILIRHLRTPLLCQEQALLYVVDVFTCISTLNVTESLAQLGIQHVTN